MSFQLIATFSTASELAAAAALLAGAKGNVKTGAASTANDAASSRTAEAGKADAPETKGEPSLPEVKDFDKELMPKLQVFAKKDSAAFQALMKKHGFSKASDIKAKPETWGALAAAVA